MFSISPARAKAATAVNAAAMIRLNVLEETTDE